MSTLNGLEFPYLVVYNYSHIHNVCMYRKYEETPFNVLVISFVAVQALHYIFSSTMIVMWICKDRVTVAVHALCCQ